MSGLGLRHECFMRWIDVYFHDLQPMSIPHLPCSQKFLFSVCLVVYSLQFDVSVYVFFGALLLERPAQSM